MQNKATLLIKLIFDSDRVQLYKNEVYTVFPIKSQKINNNRFFFKWTLKHLNILKKCSNSSQSFPAILQFFHLKFKIVRTHVKIGNFAQIYDVKSLVLLIKHIKQTF